MAEPRRRRGPTGIGTPTPVPRPSAAGPAAGTVKLPAAVAIVLVVVVLAVIAVGAIVSFSTDRLPSGPAVAPPPAGPAPTRISYDAATRRTSIEELSYVAPAAPYVCQTAPAAQLPTFTTHLACHATVHEDYQPSGADWISAVGLGVLDPSQIQTDVSATADQVFTSVVAQNYPVGVEVRGRTNGSFGLAPAGQGIVITADLHYSVKNVPSRYDAIVVAVVKLESGAYAAWYGMRPDDTPKGTRQVLVESVQTLTARK
ncbi:MAG TPA: hypothetical protein VLJ88_04720 [Propionibacteriaceae bacterium]|nr:hypothetical protein [Propionibacteriaceae bacterium]